MTYFNTITRRDLSNGLSEQDATPADVQAAWEAFCSVPSYCERDTSAEPFDAVAIARRLTLARASIAAEGRQ